MHSFLEIHNQDTVGAGKRLAWAWRADALQDDLGDQESFGY